MHLVTPLYAGLLALLFLVLSYRVVLARRSQKVSVGDGGDKLMVKRMRTQANLAEYGPVAVLLLLLLELQGAPVWSVHGLGVMLLAGRGLHAWGFGSTPQVVPARIWGMYLTVGMLAVTALANIASVIF